MLRLLELENVKSFGQLQQVPLSRITLLYGPNSGGKSSIIQSLLVMKQTLAIETPHPFAPLLSTGTDIDLGGFVSLLHRHDEERTVSFGYRFDIEEPHGLLKFISDDAERPTGAEVRLSYRAGEAAWSAGLGSALSAIRVAVSGEHRFEATLVRRCPQGFVGRSGRFMFADQRSALSFADYLRNAGRYSRQVGEYDWEYLPVGDPLPEWLRANPEGYLKLDVLLGTPLSGWRLETVAEPPRELEELVRRMSEVHDPSEGSAHELQKILAKLMYMGPLRAYPARHYALTGSLTDSVGAAGEHTLDVIAAGGDDLTERLRGHMEKLGIPYSLSVERLSSKVSGDLSMLILNDARTGTAVSSADVGFGISQLLPIVVQGTVASDRILCVEQPEIHLHPQLQARLGDFFIETLEPGVITGRTRREAAGNQWIIETHSEALMLRLQRRIREGVIAADDVSVVYVDPRGEDGSAVLPLRLDEAGEFIDEWPGGFFEEGYREIFGGSPA